MILFSVRPMRTRRGRNTVAVHPLAQKYVQGGRYGRNRINSESYSGSSQKKWKCAQFRPHHRCVAYDGHILAQRPHTQDQLDRLAESPAADQRRPQPGRGCLSVQPRRRGGKRKCPAGTVRDLVWCERGPEDVGAAAPSGGPGRF